MFHRIAILSIIIFIFCTCKEQKYVGDLVDWPGVKQGHLKAYTEEGILYEEAHYIKDTLNGQRKIYYPDGHIHIIENYKFGTFHGPYISYHPNGEKYVEGNYVQSKMSGKWKTFYISGKLKEEVTFSNNLENGPFTEYYENGNLKAEGNYKGGDKEDGLLLLYDTTGQLIRKMNCEVGICHTIWKQEAIDE